MTLTRFNKDTQVQNLAEGLNGNSDTVENHFNAINPHPHGRLVKNIAGGSNVTLTDEESRNAQLVFTGTLTANIAVILPNNNMIYHVQNLTTGNYTLTVRTGGGSGVPIQQANLPNHPRIKRVMVDGTNVVWADDSQVVEDNWHVASPAAGHYEIRANGYKRCQIRLQAAYSAVTLLVATWNFPVTFTRPPHPTIARDHTDQNFSRIDHSWEVVLQVGSVSTTRAQGRVRRGAVANFTAGDTCFVYMSAEGY